ncbi:MAG: hypothetical protein CSB02_00020 [Bacteroidia bacterium]|nr:MAG: hypothetical protein CSB02_00020 [Bacteroidia bacterium]
MKHFFLSLVLLSSLLSIAQQPFNHDIRNRCSHFKSFENSFRTPPRDNTHVADTYNPHYMHMKMDVHSDRVDIAGDISTYAKVTSAQLDTIYLELNQAFSLDSIKLNDVLTTSYTFENSEIFIVLDTPLNQGDDFKINVCYHGAVPAGMATDYSGVAHFYLGLYKTHGAFSHSEPFGARHWFPVRQSLQYKIDSVYQEYTCPTGNMVGSNGVLEQITANNDSTTTFHWKTRYPMAYYLISFAVSDYMEYNVYAKPAQLQGDSILIQNFIYNDPKCLNFYKDDIEASVGIMEVFCEKFGLYPFYKEKYGNCLASNAGMEHQTMSSVGNFDFHLNAHEMAHQWFGDNITCGTWSDIWLNEGFAIYAEVVAKEFLVGHDAAIYYMERLQRSAMRAKNGSVYVPEDEVYYGDKGRIFSLLLTYYKGGCLIHQLRYLINNDDTFFGFLQHYIDAFRDQMITTDQFRDALEDYTGLDLHSYFEQWCYGQGYPTYSVACEQGEGGHAHFTITQTTCNTATPFFDLPLEIKVLYANEQGDSTFRMPITANTSYFDIQLPYQVDSILIDPNHWIINKVGEVSVGIDELQNDLDLVVGPNPAQNYLQVHFKKTNTPMNIDIFDISGQLMQSYRLYQSGQHIDISQLPNAYYLIQATQGQATVSKKIVKI